MIPHMSCPRSRFVLLLVALALLLPPVSFAGSPPSTPLQPLYAPGEVLIGWQPSQGPIPEVQRVPGRFELDRSTSAWQGAAAAISRSTGLDVLDAAPEHGMARLKVRVGSEAAEIARLTALSWVKYAEPNYYARAADVTYPNDPDFRLQWNLHRVKAVEAWPMTRGSQSFIVAVLDTGIDATHPEFQGQLSPSYLWRNYITGQNEANDDNKFSHGTHVAGILAARVDNLQGVAGLAPNIKILPQKVLDDQGYGPYYAISGGIHGAVDRGAQVINLSLAGPPADALFEAVKYAQDHNALVVAAAGNCAERPNVCWDGSVSNPDVFPAGYPGVLAVAASDRFDRTTAYSGYKPYVGLAAPGGTEADQIWSTANPANGPYYAPYRYMYGTSMSTPMVSAAAALVWTLRPAALPDEITDILKSTADKVGTDPYSGEPLSYSGGRNDYFGAGRLDVANAVRWAYPPSLGAATDNLQLLLGGAFTSTAQSVSVSNASSQGVYWQASVVAGAPWLSLSQATGTSVYGTPAAVAIQANRLNLASGAYVGIIRIAALYPAGLAPVDVRVQLRVTASLLQTYLPVVSRDFESTWQDPDAAGSLSRTVLPLSNDSLMTLGLPFPVPFYGASHQTLQVSDNGFIVFGPPSGVPAQAPTACPGDGRAPNNAVYVLAYDWNPTLGGQVIAHEPDPQTYVITWQDVRRTASPLQQSFQLVIRNDGTMRGNYRSVETPLPGIIGAENYDGTFSQQVICNGAGRQVKSGEFVEFDTRLPW